MKIKDFGEKVNSWDDDFSVDRNFIGHLKEAGEYKNWVKENPNVVVYADIFSKRGPGKVWHSVHDTYQNIYDLCKSKHWKYTVYGVDPAYTHTCRKIWSEND